MKIGREHVVRIIMGAAILLFLVILIVLNSGGPSGGRKDRGVITRLKGYYHTVVGGTFEPDEDRAGEYPDDLLKKLDINARDIAINRDRFLKNEVHTEWMGRVGEVLLNLPREKRDAIVRNHTALLYMKSVMDDAYLDNRISHRDFTEGLGDLMKWHVKSYLSFLTPQETSALFDMPLEEVNIYVDQMTRDIPEYSFITNKNATPEEIGRTIQGDRLDDVNTEFKKFMKERSLLGNLVEANEMTREEAREKTVAAEQAFVEKCKEVLTAKEIALVFGSAEALDSMVGTPGAPPLSGRDAEETIGFPVENPDTTLDMIDRNFSQQELESLQKLNVQKRKKIDAVIAGINAGKITTEQSEELVEEALRSYREKCRSVLSPTQYALLFGDPKKNR